MKNLAQIKKSKMLTYEQELVVVYGTGKGKQALKKGTEYKVGNELAKELIANGKATEEKTK